MIGIRALLAALVGGAYVAYVAGGIALGASRVATSADVALSQELATAHGWWSLPRTVSGSLGQQVPRLGPNGEAEDSLGEGLVRAPSLFFNKALLPQRRFTVLLLGSDNDLKFPAEAVLTQSMILVSIDPSTHDVSMVSIPRDFWVPIPGFGNAKIDVAYEVGGIALARTTVERLLNVRIDYYAWVGLDGLVHVIDTLGGVDVTVLHPILDEEYPDDLYGPDPYAYFRLYIPAGPQHLDGTTALQYVRSRHGDLQSDFGRSVRQQQVLLAIKKLAADPVVISRAPDLAEAMGDAVKTDLTLPQVLSLAALARGIPPSQIRQQVLAAPDFARLGVAPDGVQQIVIPDWQAIRPVVADLLHLHADGVADSLAQDARREQATIQVLNGAAEDNLATRTAGLLTWQGLKVSGVGTAARSDYPQSEVVMRDGSKPATVQLLEGMLGGKVAVRLDPTQAADVTVVVGKNHPPLEVPRAP